MEFPLLTNGTARVMPLVLLHGYPLDHSIWEPLVPRLENDFDLILPDLRGFGESQTVETDFAMSDCAADIAALLDQLDITESCCGWPFDGWVRGPGICKRLSRKHCLGWAWFHPRRWQIRPKRKPGATRKRKPSWPME